MTAKFKQVHIRAYDSGPSSSAKSARIAVVIPVFNAMPYLRELVDSVSSQDLDPTLFEVIAVDDGSTDGGGKFLEVFAASHPNWRVIRQRNSGWPGKPRNVGIDASSSDYVFFCDADDIMAPEALRRMLEFADKNEVDVLAPRMVGIGGRRVSPTLYSATMTEAPLRKILATLSPQKLVRRTLLDQNSFRFPEGRIRLEDGMLMTRCYLASKRNSILADYDFYFLRSRDDGSNISAQGSAPESYTGSVDRIARIIKDNHHDPKEADLLTLDLYRRKILRSYVPNRFLGMSSLRRRRWIRAHAKFVGDHIPPHLEHHLEFPFLQRSQLVRTRDSKALLRLATAEGALKPDCEVILPTPDDTELRFRMDSSTVYQSARLLAFARGNPSPLSFDLRSHGTAFGLALPVGELAQLGNVIIDLYVQLKLDGIEGPPCRVRAPSADMRVAHPDIPMYSTARGHFSLDQRNRLPQSRAAQG